MPRLLVACEYSGVVRDSFAERGWDAWSCDLRPSDTPGNHIQGDVLPLLEQDWDLLIAHPPCDFLTNSGNRWLYEEWTVQERYDAGKQGKTLTGHSPRRNEQRWMDREEGATFYRRFLNTGIPHVAVENPVMNGDAAKLVEGKATQFVQPYEFGVMESKRTGLRLQNLPLLVPTNNVETEMRKLPKKVWAKCHYMSPGPDREKERSRTSAGIAQAMADQWGPYVEAAILESVA